MYTGFNESEETLTEPSDTKTPIAGYLRWSVQYLADQGVPTKLDPAEADVTLYSYLT